MLLAVEHRLVHVGGEVAPRRRDASLGDATHELLVLAAVLHELGDGDHQQPVLLAELDQVGHPGHGAVVVDDLAQHAGGVHAGEAGQVDRRLGVAGTLEHAALGVAQREDVTRAGEVDRLGRRVDERLDGRGAVGGRDAGARAVHVVDRVGERGAVRLGVVVDHQRDVELVEPLARQGRTDHARRVAHEERDVLGCRGLGGHDQVAFVLTVLVVDDDDDLAPCHRCDRVLDRGEGRVGRTLVLEWFTGHDRSPVTAFGAASCATPGAARIPAISRSAYLAITSTSRFTASPDLSASERRHLGGVRDDRDGEAVVEHVDHGQRDAVDGDRALLDDVAHERSGHLHPQVGHLGHDQAHAVDVALHQVAAEAVLETHRPLQVHGIAGSDALQRRAGERLVADVGLPPVVAPGDDGQAAAVHGDRRAHRHVGEHRGCPEPQSRPGERLDRSQFLDDPGEHLSPLPSARRARCADRRRRVRRRRSGPARGRRRPRRPRPRTVHWHRRRRRAPVRCR